MMKSILLTYFSNIGFLLLPIHSLLVVCLNKKNSNVKTQANRSKLIETALLSISFMFYLANSIIAKQKYLSIFFTIQLATIQMTVVVSGAMKQFTSSYRMSTNKKNDSDISNYFEQRGLLVEHDDADDFQNVYYDSISRSAKGHQKKPSQNLEFYISEEDEDEDEDDEDNDQILTCNGNLMGEAPLERRNRLKLNAPVLATLLALSPVHTEASPIPILSPLVTPIDSNNLQSSPFAQLPLLQLFAIAFLLLSQLADCLNTFMKPPSNQKTSLIKDAFQFLLLIVTALFAEPTLFIYQAGIDRYWPLYALLSSTGLVISIHLSNIYKHRH